MPAPTTSRRPVIAFSPTAPYGVHLAELSGVTFKEKTKEIVLTFSTPAGEIVRRSPISTQGKGSDFIRAMFGGEFVPDSTLSEGDRVSSILQSRIGTLYTLSYSRKQSGKYPGVLSVVPCLSGQGGGSQGVRKRRQVS